MGVKQRDADDRGRVTLGSDWAGKTVEIRHVEGSDAFLVVPVDAQSGN